MIERIEAAALRLDGITYSLPRPARHENVKDYMTRRRFTRNQIYMAEQGFITNTGRFVSRHDAVAIAIQARQIINGDPETYGQLTTANLW